MAYIRKCEEIEAKSADSGLFVVGPIAITKWFNSEYYLLFLIFLGLFEGYKNPDIFQNSIAFNMDGLRWSYRNKGSDSTWNELCFEEGAKKKILLTQKPPPKEKKRYKPIDLSLTSSSTSFLHPILF